MGLTDEDGSPSSVAKLLVAVAVSSAHRCFCGVEHRPTAAVNGQGPVAPAHHLLTDGAHTPGRRSTLLG